MAIYFQGDGEHWYYFQGFGEQAPSFWGLREPCKKVKKKSHLKGKAFISSALKKNLPLLVGSPPDPSWKIEMSLLSCSHANIVFGIGD